jgi:serine/threonine-protein kinase
VTGDDDRTVFQPGPAPAPPAPEADAPEADAEVTIPPVAAPPPAPAPAPPPAAPRAAAGVAVGDVLNHMFEVRRFLARGGMGEVFEGVNMASDERVAIKIILPALAADPNVQAMFRKEAQTLTRLSHPALVQYRVLAQEPQLGVFYIVTEFIDGVDLASVIGKVTPTLADMIALTRRLAEGLRAAHELGAIHRDIAPDNVLLQDGRLNRARIIDFGIAKDVDPGSKTIIGDGFAGKLGYVAPEQLGMYGRDVGPWTDVYSLGLVLLALAKGQQSKLGGSFVEAIDKRRAGVDTSGAPPEMRPLLTRMLALDPAERFRDMDAVLAGLAAVERGEVAAPPAPVPEPPKAPKPVATDAKPAKPAPSRGLLYGGGAAAAVALLGGIGWIAFGGGGAPTKPATTAPAAAPAAAGAGLDKVRGAIQAKLPGLSCSWLSLTSAAEKPQGISLAFSGVAGQPAAAESDLLKAVQAAGGSVAESDFSEVAPIDASFCAVLDGLRGIRAEGAPRLSVTQRKFEISTFTEGESAGQQGARVIVDMSLADLPGDLALYSVEESGEISEIVGSRAAFDQAAKTSKAIEQLPGRDHYRLQLDAVRKPGWAGILLLTGKGGFNEKLLHNASAPGWRATFDKAAAANGWRAEILWFRFVDETPN